MKEYQFNSATNQAEREDSLAISESSSSNFVITEAEELEVTPVIACSVAGGTTGCS